MCSCYSYVDTYGLNPKIRLQKPEWSSRHGDTIEIDACIAAVVKNIWDAGYITLSSCCGHGKDSPSLVLGSGSDSSHEKLLDICKIIKSMDGRVFRLYRWELIEI